MEGETADNTSKIHPKQWPSAYNESYVRSPADLLIKVETFLGAFRTTPFNYHRVIALMESERAKLTFVKREKIRKQSTASPSPSSKGKRGGHSRRTSEFQRRGSESLKRRQSEAILQRGATSLNIVSTSKDEIKKAFEVLDIGKRGIVTAKDLKRGPIGTVFHPELPVKEFHSFLPPDEKYWTMESFLEINSRPRLDIQVNDRLHEAFKIYDPNGTGFIDPDVFKQVMADLGCGELSDEEMHVILEFSDADGDGQIGFDDFRNLLRTAEEKRIAAEREKKMEDILHEKAIERIIREKFSPPASSPSKPDLVEPADKEEPKKEPSGSPPGRKSPLKSPDRLSPTKSDKHEGSPGGSPLSVQGQGGSSIPQLM